MKHPLTVDQMLERLRELSEQGHGDKPLVRGRMGGVCESLCAEEGNYLADVDLITGVVVLGFEEGNDFEVQGDLPSEPTWC